MTLSAPSDQTPRRLVTHNVVHLHLKPTRSAEMVSQTLIGHSVTVLEEQEGWARVQTDDTYRGWAETRWLSPDLGVAGLISVITPFLEVRTKPQEDAPLVSRLSIGSRIVPVQRLGEGDGWDGWATVHLPSDLAATYYALAASFPREMQHRDSFHLGTRAAEWATSFLGTPYLWGGSSSFGLDCSGFVQLCYRLAGITLRRDADIQREDPRFEPVAFDSLLPGDLVFFGKPDRITHVGMHSAGRTGDAGTFVHSAGGAGVIVSPWGDPMYSPGYVDARRLIPARASEPVTRHEAEDR
ncbi:MAG: C40 family peptidase [Cytophagales bacterium]|nr:C40 family peptidase [Armatimonadota bacterium]